VAAGGSTTVGCCSITTAVGKLTVVSVATGALGVGVGRLVARVHAGKRAASIMKRIIMREWVDFFILFPFLSSMLKSR
jgi:hypothetical protein